MARVMPIRRKDFDVQRFLAFVAEHGGEVGTPTNPYEVVRYRAYWRGTQTSSIHIVYAKENGLLTWTGGSQGHYRAFLDGTPMEQLPGADVWERSAELEAKLKSPKRSKSAITRENLRERDGDDCWFCGAPMGDDCTIEHLIPKSKGGRDSLSNYALAHLKCNNDAANLPLVQKIALRATLHAQAGRNPSGPGREAGPVREHEHAVGEADAPTLSPNNPKGPGVA